jgi:alpha-beta hydrolase superfamily lysophospholipase/SAM-dependent methyltransferase
MSITIAASTSTTHSAALWDGSEIFYRAWLPPEPTTRAVVLFHRGHEHSGRLADVVAGLNLRNAACFAWDARGHGRSEGERGDAPSFGALVRDVESFMRHLVAEHGVRFEDTVVVGHSVGAVAVAAWAHDYAPRLRGLVLATPALRVRLYVPFARAGLRLLMATVGRPRFVSSYVKGRMLTHDPDEARAYDDDPLVSRRISVRVLLGLHDAATRVLEDAAAIRSPALVVAGGADWVVDLGAERRLFDRLGSAVKRMKVFDGMYHDVLHERGRADVVAEIRAFVDDVFASPTEDEPLLDADVRGHTRDEFDRLKGQLPLWSPKGLAFRASRLFLATVGRLSEGIRIGWQDGFDSGRSLDYVYENRARGWTPLGRLIDRIYLHSPGWSGVRTRRTNLETLLREAIRETARNGEPVRVLDVAAGHGRYVFEAMRAMPNVRVEARLRDWSEANVAAIQRAAAKLGLAHTVVAEQSDAFDRATLEEISPSVDVAIASGIYELFSDNAGVLASLTGLAAAIRTGGVLLYTGQPWHPQLELIARVLTNRDGEPWVMRRRTQRELDDLVRAAGFEKIRTLADDEGIFTVSVARRR